MSGDSGVEHRPIATGGKDAHFANSALYLRPIGIFVLGLLLLTAASALYVNGLIRRIEMRASADLVRSTESPAGLHALPEPRLQDHAVQDLRQMRTQEDSTLNSYGWIDQAKGIVRIPVGRAMELLVARPRRKGRTK